MNKWYFIKCLKNIKFITVKSVNFFLLSVKGLVVIVIKYLKKKCVLKYWEFFVLFLI